MIFARPTVAYFDMAELALDHRNGRSILARTLALNFSACSGKAPQPVSAKVRRLSGRIATCYFTPAISGRLPLW